MRVPPVVHNELIVLMLKSSKEAVNINFLSLLVWLDEEIEPRSAVYEVDARK